MEEKKILNGKNIANEILKSLDSQIVYYKNLGENIGLKIILIGENTASLIYTERKIKVANSIGIDAKLIKLSENTTFQEIKIIIDELNLDKDTHGIIVQLPLPKTLNAIDICNLIHYKKDIDGLSFENAGKLQLGFRGEYFHKPCTPSGCIYLLEKYNIDLQGKKCLIINRSNIVGKPLFHLLIEKNAFVQIAHSKVKNLNDVILDSDVIFSATGNNNFITRDMIKNDAILIDIGITKNIDGKICGDINFHSCFDKASFITPVPGGIGPMTIAFLMQNIVNVKKYFGNNL